MTTMQEDLNAAKHLLRTNGFAFRIYGPDQVRDVLHEYQRDDFPKATEDSIIKHVMEGDDWADLSGNSTEDERLISNIIDGTLHDHPEWNQSRSEWLEGIARDWMYRHGQHVYEGIAADIEEEAEVELTDDDANAIVDLIERAEIKIVF